MTANLVTVAAALGSIFVNSYVKSRFLSHRQGQARIMRRRVQAERDQPVAAAGFRKIERRIDEWGIFTVSVAERIVS